MLADDRRAWELGADDTWRRVEQLRGEPGTVDTFEALMSEARSAQLPAGQ